MSLKEKALSFNTLVCLLQSLKGRKTSVELRNESSVYGRIEMVDAYMNVQMTEIIFTNPIGDRLKFSNFFVQGRQIRFVHIPDDINVVQTIRQFVEPLRKVKQPTYKNLLAKKHHREILQKLASSNYETKSEGIHEDILVLKKMNPSLIYGKKRTFITRPVGGADGESEDSCLSSSDDDEESEQSNEDVNRPTPVAVVTSGPTTSGAVKRQKLPWRNVPKGRSARIIP